MDYTANDIKLKNYIMHKYSERFKEKKRGLIKNIIKCRKQKVLQFHSVSIHEPPLLKL